MYRKQKNEKDVLYILEHLRADDLEEVKAVHGDKWKENVLSDIMKTDFDVLMGVTKDGDIPVCMGGAWAVNKVRRFNDKNAPITPEDNGVGYVWMLCTDEIVNHKICLLRELKKEFRKYDNEFWLLCNFIYYKNEFAKKWLKWMGFDFSNPHPNGLNVPQGFEFFYRIRKRKGLL